MATWVAAEAGEHDALATLTQASRGLLVTQALQPAAHMAANGPLAAGLPPGQAQQSGFGGAAAGAVTIVKSEPLTIWQPGQSLPKFAGSVEGMDMNPPGASPELPSFDLGTGLDDFDPGMPIGALEMPAAHPF